MSNILIGCEESQTICGTFRRQGYNAYSCDILPTRGNPEWHYQDDILNIVPLKYWDLIILHPDCTAMANSGNKYYAKGKPLYHERLKAIRWTINLWNLARRHSTRTALENPRSVIFSYFKNVQYIQPWNFGHYEKKFTGFVLYNLPRLKKTQIVEDAIDINHNMSQSNKDRKRDRSKTYQGIADAIVDQWGRLV